MLIKLIHVEIVAKHQLWIDGRLIRTFRSQVGLRRYLKDYRQRHNAIIASLSLT